MNLVFIKKIGIIIGGWISGFLILINILTYGNIYEWFSYNFLGVARYQFWYFARTPFQQFLLLSQIPINFELFCV